jgi:hypothetical protein
MFVFIDFGEDSELISIGLVASNKTGTNYYREVSDFDRSKSSAFVQTHIYPLLEGGVKQKNFSDIADEIWDWLNELGKEDELHFVIDYEGDWLWLLGLLHRAHKQGKQSVLPPNMNKQPIWLLSLIDLNLCGGWEKLCKQYNKEHNLRVHHALDDAIRNMLIFWSAPRIETPSSN